MRFFQAEDQRDLFAAYKLAKGKAPYFEENLGPNEFVDALSVLINGFDASFVIQAERPLGLVLGMQDGVLPHIMWPHVWWFPWATPRNKIEGTLKFITELRDDFLLLIVGKEDEKDFWVHICKYGVLERIGKLPGYFGLDDPREPRLFRSQKSGGRRS